MLQQLKKRKDSEGFTIIEVLIVLAIAGLIMVVVFLAVPALQRSGRNNAMNSDAQAVLTAAGNYSSNNGGALPTGAALNTATGVVTITGPGGNNETAKVGTGTVATSVGGTAITNAAAVGTIQIVTGTTAACNSTSTGLGGTAGSARSVAVLYVAEGGGGNILKCIGS